MRDFIGWVLVSLALMLLLGYHDEDNLDRSDIGIFSFGEGKSN
jgi:hypothetical protein